MCVKGLCQLQEVMLRRLKREVMGQLPPKRRQVVRLPLPEAKHWPKEFRRPSDGGSSRSSIWYPSAQAAKEATLLNDHLALLQAKGNWSCHICIPLRVS